MGQPHKMFELNESTNLYFFTFQFGGHCSPAAPLPPLLDASLHEEQQYQAATHFQD